MLLLLSFTSLSGAFLYKEIILETTPHLPFSVNYFFMCFCLLSVNKQKPGQSLMLVLAHMIKEEAMQSSRALIYNIESHQGWSREVIWSEESDKIDQLITNKSTSPMDGSSASADQYGCDKS